MSRREENYKYLAIRDALVCVNSKVNLMGVVVEFRNPLRSKGTDYFCTLKIIDESYQSPGLLVTFFAENIEKLPRVKSAGDIICLSRLKIESKNGKVTASFSKQYTSYALFEGKSCHNFVPYQAPSNFRLSTLDKDIIACRRMWFRSLQPDPGGSLLLREIKEGQWFNLVSKIVHVCGVSKMLFVWDGSDAPPVSCQTRLSNEMENPLPLLLEDSPLPRDLLSTFPRVGTILRVNIEQGNGAFDLHLLSRGTWVKFLNIVCQERSGLLYGVFEQYSELQILSPEDIIVKGLQRIYEERLSSKWGHMPLTCFPWHSRITETDFEHIPYVSLMHVLTSRKVLGRFKCIVRVVAICPWRVEDFFSPLGTCSYRMRLTIEDPTARIHAHIYAEDGEKFFNGYPSMDVLTLKCNKLLGITEGDDGKHYKTPRHPPWVECCISSYYVDKHDPWASRKYRIFGTKLLV